ncbi:hypothetical protein BP6252_03543 [Coleophoma cylindrospora]|uniref:Sister chromatid cohesion protein Ctf8 n=1 Tax=Coleophoma cylindrospora TaxID=1849047 RepID=A0A3D8S8H5_9HELO|nr:hypothetical protein BP6252_03543 [Coleophoma cylindrospora]
MASIPLYPRAKNPMAPQPNPLPQLLQTPSGLALLELQGTINLPSHSASSSADDQVAIGRLIFPHYDPASQDPKDTSWMKRVYMYVGKHQRLTGEVKKLPKPMAIIRKRVVEDDSAGSGDLAGGEERSEELEVVEIVKWKILFSLRPEPVGTSGVAD